MSDYHIKGGSRKVPKGFALIDKEKHLEYSAKGGSKKVPKGAGTSAELRAKISKAQKERWVKYRAEKANTEMAQK